MKSKTHIILRAFLLTIVFGDLQSWATEKPTCETIQNSCGEAGFTRDMPAGKDLMKKCFEPIMIGQKVEGVSIDPDLIKKCQDEQKAKPTSNKKHKRGGP